MSLFKPIKHITFNATKTHDRVLMNKLNMVAGYHGLPAQATARRLLEQVLDSEISAGHAIDFTPEYYY